jgi:hypothetical protein
VEVCNSATIYIHCKVANLFYEDFYSVNVPTGPGNLYYLGGSQGVDGTVAERI